MHTYWLNSQVKTEEIPDVLVGAQETSDECAAEARVEIHRETFKHQILPSSELQSASPTRPEKDNFDGRSLYSPVTYEAATRRRSSSRSIKFNITSAKNVPDSCSMKENSSQSNCSSAVPESHSVDFLQPNSAVCSLSLKGETVKSKSMEKNRDKKCQDHREDLIQTAKMGQNFLKSEFGYRNGSPKKPFGRNYKSSRLCTML